MDSNSKKSLWDSKPFWCQPWSIISFGVLVLIISWNLFENATVTSVLLFLVFVWWILFLIIAPYLYQLNNDKK